MLELAIVFPVFLLFLLFLFQVAYDQFVQTELEGAVQLTAYQVQVGNYSDTTVGTFIDKDFCGNALAGALNCQGLYVRLQNVDPTQCTSHANDFYDMTSGALPISGGVLNLGDYENDQGNPGGGSATGPSACGTAPQETGFCNAGANQFIIFTAIYVTPTFLGGLIPGTAYTYNNQTVHAAIATEAFYTEKFLTPPAVETSPAC